MRNLAVTTHGRLVSLAMALGALGAMAIPLELAAQEQREDKQQHLHYTVTDLGTLGGTFSFAVGINDKRSAVGFSTLPGDMNEHAFLWRRGVITDLGTLGGPNSTPSFSPFSERGEVGGLAETSKPDPNGEDSCGFRTGLICLPVVWHDGNVTSLPTLGGNNGAANQVNNRGQVAGTAENGTPPPPCLQGLAVPVLWDNGQVRSLSMFSGDQAGVALAINDRGQAAGFSASCTVFHALLWENGKAMDLGNLGGTSSGAAAINTRREVVGGSSLPGNATSDAFIWRNGVMTDLGTLPGDIGSNALGINDRSQVVGVSTIDVYGDTRAFLWQDGLITDLNTLIPVGSPWFLVEADSINSRGEIVGGAFNMSTGEVHGILAIPCDDEHPGREGCEENAGATVARSETRPSPEIVLPENVRNLLQQHLTRQHRYSGFGVRLPK